MNEIMNEIEKIEKLLSKPEELGLGTEVYSRISGYYRSTRNWNPGKQSELRDRVNYSIAR